MNLFLHVREEYEALLADGGEIAGVPKWVFALESV